MVNIVKNTTKFCELEICSAGIPVYCVIINKRTRYVKVMTFDPFSNLLDGYATSERMGRLPILLRHLKSISNLMDGEDIERRLLRILLIFLNV